MAVSPILQLEEGQIRLRNVRFAGERLANVPSWYLLQLINWLPEGTRLFNLMKFALVLELELRQAGMGEDEREARILEATDQLD